MNRAFLITFILIILSISACQKSGLEKMPGIDIPIQDMNKHLHLTAPTEINSFKFGENVLFVLANTSDNSIFLSENYGVHIFIKKDNKWSPIENNFEYPSGEKEILPRQNQQFRDEVFAIHPMVNDDKSVTLRVVVVGNSQKGGLITSQNVAAYTDVILKP